VQFDTDPNSPTFLTFVRDNRLVTTCVHGQDQLFSPLWIRVVAGARPWQDSSSRRRRNLLLAMNADPWFDFGGNAPRRASSSDRTPYSIVDQIFSNTSQQIIQPSMFVWNRTSKPSRAAMELGISKN